MKRQFKKIIKMMKKSFNKNRNKQSQHKQKNKKKIMTIKTTHKPLNKILKEPFPKRPKKLLTLTK